MLNEKKIINGRWKKKRVRLEQKIAETKSSKGKMLLSLNPEKIRLPKIFPLLEIICGKLAKS